MALPTAPEVLAGPQLTGMRPVPDEALPTERSGRYIPIWVKFAVSQSFALAWVTFSIWLSLPWLRDLAGVVTWPGAIAMITFIAYVPGYLVALLCSSLLMDRLPLLKVIHPTEPITVLIAARNERTTIGPTLTYLAAQDYDGPVSIIVIDNGSTDGTTQIARRTARRLGLDVRVLSEATPGKSHALNTGLAEVETELVATVDADTLLHPSALRLITARMRSAPPEVVAVAGHVLVRNSRETMIARMQDWDYSLGVSAIKRIQGMYQGTLVAQGAFSIYERSVVEGVGGWPEGVGEDIILTWRFLGCGGSVHHEPLAVGFTTVPVTLRTLARQRARWARGMIEAVRDVHPFRQPRFFPKFLSSVNLAIPWLDFAFTFVWVPGLVLAFTGRFWIVGIYTVLVVPLSFGASLLMRRSNRQIFRTLGLRVRRNRFGFVIYVLGFQLIQSPVSLWGYARELLDLEKTW